MAERHAYNAVSNQNCKIALSGAVVNKPGEIATNRANKQLHVLYHCFQSIDSKMQGFTSIHQLVTSHVSFKPLRLSLKTCSWRHREHTHRKTTICGAATPICQGCMPIWQSCTCGPRIAPCLQAPGLMSSLGLRWLPEKAHLLGGSLQRGCSLLPQSVKCLGAGALGESALLCACMTASLHPSSRAPDQARLHRHTQHAWLSLTGVSSFESKTCQ